MVTARNFDTYKISVRNVTNPLPTLIPKARAMQGKQANNRLVVPTKLTPPGSAPAAVARLELRNLLCTEEVPRLTLIRAPAGFGKSTLMQQAYQALQQQQVPVAWLTLDNADNDVARLLHFLRLALASLNQQAVNNQALDVGNLALAVLDYAAQMQPPFVLFLDDLEVLQNSTALALIQQLVECLPQGGRIILGSRALPDIGIARLRGRGELLEIDPLKLRFTAQETQSFLQQTCQQPLSTGELKRLHHTTEGWPVALRLASLLLQECPNNSVFVEEFSGANSFVADYLAEEVLARQPKVWLEFMLQTSLLPQLSAPLCNAICAIDNSQEILEHLERASIFLYTLDSQRQEFRYHGLFAVFLRSQLQKKYPEKIPHLHLAAAKWYLQNQRPIPAIEQAILAKDWEFALPLFNQQAEHLLSQGRSRLLVRLFELIPEQQLHRWPVLQIVHMWAVAFTRGAAEAMELLTKYENDDHAEESMVAHIVALRPMLLSILDRNDLAYSVASQTVAAIADKYVFPQAIFHTSYAYVALVMGHYPLAQQLLDHQPGQTQADAGPFTSIYSQCVEGVMELMQGRLRQALSRFRLATNIHVHGINSSTNGNTMAAILLVEVLYETGELNSAQRLLQVYVPLMREQGVPEHLISGHRNLARIQFAQGERESALQTLMELEYCGHINELPRLVANAHLERARFFLLQGHGQAARDEIKRAAELCDWPVLEQQWLFANDQHTCCEAELRWQIHFGEATSAAAQLTALIAEAEQLGRHRRALKFKILLALAFFKQGEKPKALALLAEILTSAAAENSVQSLIDEGELMQQLFVHFAQEQRLPLAEALFTEPRQLITALANANNNVGINNGSALACSDQLTEKLTRKESQVLQLLAEGLTNAAIAGQLFVSENTVRTHLRNINSKLHSQSRTEAVAIARRKGILH